ncbi:hypothetical protein [Dysgonomonas termitidis]|uniref:Uncharacterized protein n=1 Tax=Dysgonomonas termitidis TaxID=1516126 RepID=A0ABV9KR64_9BACT
MVAETKAYQKIPVLTDFMNEEGIDTMEQEIRANYDRVREEAKLIVEREIKRIKEDDNLKHLIKD